jgi:hypothetical protein
MANLRITRVAVISNGLRADGLVAGREGWPHDPERGCASAHEVRHMAARRCGRWHEGRAAADRQRPFVACNYLDMMLLDEAVREPMPHALNAIMTGRQMTQR